MTGRVLITGARAPVALELARSFRAAGFEPHLADSAPARMARASTAPAAVHRHAPPRQDPHGFRRDIRALAATLDPVLIVPTCEEVFHMAAAAPSLGLEDRLFAPGLERLRELHRKSAFVLLCERLGLHAPRTRKVESPGELTAFAEQAGQLVFKPDWSRFGDRTLVRPPLHALARIRPTATEPWCVQDHVEGEEICFYATARDNALRAFAAYRPRWQAGGGASFAFEPVGGRLAARLEAAASVLAERAVGQGQFACDAIVDAAGRAWLIECNPRATSGAHLFEGPALARAIAQGRPAVADQELRYLSPAMWLLGLPAAVSRGRLDAWREDLRRGRDVVGAPGDRGPVWGAVADSAGFQLAALARGRSLAAQMTADIAWNGEAL